MGQVPSPSRRDCWVEKAIPGRKDGYDVLIIPQDTLLYKGVSTRLDSRSHRESFFGDLAVASYYAFASDFQKGELGKVITYQTKKPLYLLDMSSPNNYRRFYREFSVPRAIEALDLFQYAFGWNGQEPLKRRSHVDIDQLVVKWFRKNYANLFSGYAYTNLPGFHSEILLWDLTDVQLYDLEYRFSILYNPEVLLETRQGELTGVELTKSDISTTEMKVIIKWSRDSLHRPTDLVGDRYLLQEPFLSWYRVV